jgi:hypothetical protein
VPIDVPPRGRDTTRAVAFSLEPHDLILSKLAANRERDWEFATEAINAGLVQFDVLEERVGSLPVPLELQQLIARSLAAMRG